jgi:hypothetical protein
MASAQQMALVGSVAAPHRAGRHREMGDGQYVLLDEPALEVLFRMLPPPMVVTVAEPFGRGADGRRARGDPARPLEEDRAVEWRVEYLGTKLGAHHLHKALQQCGRGTVLCQ